LLNSGELLLVTDIVDKQLSSQKKIIVGLATRNQGYYYKRELYRAVKPKILVLGSSRVMQFRKTFFNTTMVNVGGAMSSINEGFSFVQDAYKYNTPELVILGLDYWWFNENALLPSKKIKPPLELASNISLQKYILPFKWLWQGKIEKEQYFNLLNPLGLFKSIDNKNIGLDGLLNQNGFGPDGSYFYTKTISGKEKNYDELFLVSLHNMEHNLDRFEYGRKVAPIHWQNFLDMVNFIHSKGSKLVVFIPPLAPTVAQRMKDFRQEYSFIDDLRNLLESHGIQYYDFHDPNVLKTSDCEFIDGIHGGDVVYGKILMYMAQRDNELWPVVEKKYITEKIEQFSDFGMIQHEETSVTEVDFLKLGCKKYRKSTI